MADQSPGFYFNVEEWRGSRSVGRMSMAERGQLFTNIVTAVATGDRQAMKQWQCSPWSIRRPLIGRVDWRQKRNRRYLPPKTRQQVFEKYGLVCVYCGSSDQIEIDHIRAYSKGGSDKLTNLQPLCRPCNRRKGAR